MTEPDTGHRTREDLWASIDVLRWEDVPCLVDRVATEEDVREGRAVFYLRSPEEIGAEYTDIGLPHCAILTVEDGPQQVPVIIIQSERAGDKHYIGFRFLNGGNGIGLLPEFELIEAPNERFALKDT